MMEHDASSYVPGPSPISDPPSGQTSDLMANVLPERVPRLMAILDDPSILKGDFDGGPPESVTLHYDLSDGTDYTATVIFNSELMTFHTVDVLDWQPAEWPPIPFDGFGSIELSNADDAGLDNFMELANACAQEEADRLGISVELLTEINSANYEAEGH